MMRRIFYFAILFFVVLTFVNCAKRGNPSGGSKDSIPPIIIKYKPENYSINFTDDEIKIYFNEYIKLIDINKELIISPPLKYQPEISPLSTGKFIKIKIKDTLKKSTTYSFNFGKSIVDYTEGNVLKYFKYIFSTGDFIDSLNLKGTVKDPLLLNPEGTTTVMLYEVNEAFNDSVIYSEKPTYVTTTKEESEEFELTNLKEGTYFLIALKDKTKDYIFQPKYDKIGFLEEMISLPTDSSFTINTFKETESYTIKKPKHESKNHIMFGYSGDAKNLQIELKSSVPKDFESTSYKDLKSDTLHYWFKPFVENDSLIFTVTNQNNLDTVVTIYNTPGSYHVTLDITNSDGCANDTTYFNYIEIYDYPVAGFTSRPNPASILNPSVQFLDTSSADVVYFDWTFYDSTNTIIGSEDWDIAILVAYPTRKQFVEMFKDPDYLRIAPIRGAALQDSRLVEMSQLLPKTLG